MRKPEVVLYPWSRTQNSVRNSMQQSQSWEANSRSEVKKSNTYFRSRRLECRLYKCPPLIKDLAKPEVLFEVSNMQLSCREMLILMPSAQNGESLLVWCLRLFPSIFANTSDNLKSCPLPATWRRVMVTRDTTRTDFILAESISPGLCYLRITEPWNYRIWCTILETHCCEQATALCSEASFLLFV
jgi:hypothetical protein